MDKFKAFFMKTAFLLAEHSHCVSYHVGAVIVKDNRIISLGYNGTPAGNKNCDEEFDGKAFDRKAHTEWSNQNEIHAESNAISFAAKNGLEIKDCDMYVTLTPCNHCLKNIVAAGIKNVYYYTGYDKSDLNPNITKHVNLVQLRSKNLDKFLKNNDLVFDSSSCRIEETKKEKKNEIFIKVDEEHKIF